MKLETKMVINESEMLDVVVKLEMYIEHLKNECNIYVENDYFKEVQLLHDKMQNIWYEMRTNEDYFLFERPF